ncbi:MAG: MFS transporter, partial [Actinomycetota bacterium]|nr:MFS transporter [Actinomycetota bacterium]
FAGFSSFLALYAIDLGMRGAGLVFVAYAGIVLLIRSFGASIPDRVGHARTASVSLALSAGGLALIGGWGRPAGLFSGTALFAVGQALAFPALMTIAVSRASAADRGAVIGTFTAFVDVAFGIGPISLGPVAATFGYPGVFVASAMVTIAGLAVFRTTLARRGSRAGIGAAAVEPPSVQSGSNGSEEQR